MKAILVKGENNISWTADGLKFEEIDKPILREGEILIKVKAFGLNRMDILQRQGRYPALPPGASPILGVEYSGVVFDAGTSSWKFGDEVFGLTAGGCYAEYVAVPSSLATLKPSSLSWAEAASIPEAWFTAYQALIFLANLKAGQKVLIHAGASGVGIAAIQFAVLYGAELVLATVGTEEKRKFVEGLGAKSINYKTEDFAEKVSEYTFNNGVDIIIDFIGRPYWTRNISSLALDGHMIMLGLMGGATSETPIDFSSFLKKRLTIQGSALRSRGVEYQTKLRDELEMNILKHVFEGKENAPRIVVHKVFDWKDIREAHVEMEEAKNIGKIVCEIR